jgi:hypothetical protein
MIQNFRGKNVKDTETAPETVISNTLISNNILSNSFRADVNNITTQQLSNENFDSYIEKRKKLN